MPRIDKTKKDTLMLKTLIKMYERGDIRIDHPLQRQPGRWSTDYRDGEIATIIKQEDIDPIKICEQIHEDCDGKLVIDNWLIDGLQRLTYPMKYRDGVFKLGNNIEFPIIVYQKARKDENGNFVEDEYGRRISDEIEYDLRGKWYDDLPEELKDAFDSYAIDVVKQLDCTNEEIGYHIRRYNKQMNMNVSEKTITYLDTIAEKIKKLSDHEFFKNDVNITTTGRKNGSIDKIVIETLMLLNHFDNWTKDGKKQGLFLKNNASDDEFSNMESILDSMMNVVDDKTFSLFNTKNAFLWIKSYEDFKAYNLPDEDFKKFINAFVEGLNGKVVILDKVQKVYGEETDRCSFNALDLSKSSKDKGIVETKLHIIRTLMDEYFLSDKHEDFDQEKGKDDVNISNQFEEFDKFITENNSLDDSEIDALTFIKNNVDENLSDDDLDDYYDYVSSIKKKKIVNKNSNILNPNNENALLATIAYGFKYCKNPKDLDRWIQKFSITHKSFVAKSQKEIFDEMIKSLNRFTITQMSQKKLGLHR